MRNALSKSPIGLEETVSRSIVIKGDSGGHREGVRSSVAKACRLRVHVTTSRRMLVEGSRVFQTPLVRAQREKGIALGTGRKVALPHGGGDVAGLGKQPGGGERGCERRVPCGVRGVVRFLLLP